ncbi:hypothetical protein ACFQX6_62180 [Streptosporangium lutulentum]
MMKKLATGLLALAATGAVALAAPATASAATTATASAATTATVTAGPSGYDYSDYWGSYYSSNHKAKARGWIGVEWDKHQKRNTVRVKGSLYDLDHRTYKQGGKCAYVKFGVHHFGDNGGQWYDGKSYTYCGAAGPSSSSSPRTGWTASASRSARSPCTAPTRPSAATGSTSTPPSE